MSIVPSSNIPVSVDYTSRDYYSLREDLISRIQSRIISSSGKSLWTASDPSDFGVALVEALSYMGDMLSYYIDRTANESHISTSVNRDSVLNHAKFYGYIPAGWRQARTTLYVSNPTAGSPVVLPAGTVVMGQSTYNDSVTTEYFTTEESVSIPGSGSAEVAAIHGISSVYNEGADSYGVQLGVSSGLPSMEFLLPDSPVADGSISLYIQAGTQYLKWTQVPHLIDYGPADMVYTADLDENDNTAIKFGDGVSGAVPPINSVIKAAYTIGGGVRGNVLPGVLRYFYNTTPALTVTNLVEATGGENPESTEEIRALAPLSMRALNRAVTLEDYESLALFVPNVGKAKAGGVSWNNIDLYIAPSRTSASTTISPGITYSTGEADSEFYSLKKKVDDYLANKLLLGVSVTVNPPTYVDLKMSVQYITRDQYDSVEVGKEVVTTLLREFHYTRMPFNDTLYPQDVEYILQRVPGVKLGRLVVLSRMTQIPTGITSISGNGTVVTVNTSAAHGLTSGTRISVSGVTTTTGYNGEWVVASATTNSFTYTSTVTGTATITYAVIKSYDNSLNTVNGSIGEIFRVLESNISTESVES